MRKVQKIGLALTVLFSFYNFKGTLDTEDLYFQTEKVIASRKELEHMNANAVKIQVIF